MMVPVSWLCKSFGASQVPWQANSQEPEADSQSFFQSLLSYLHVAYIFHLNLLFLFKSNFNIKFYLVPLLCIYLKFLFLSIETFCHLTSSMSFLILLYCFYIFNLLVFCFIVFSLVFQLSYVKYFPVLLQNGDYESSNFVWFVHHCISYAQNSARYIIDT